jgi:hypothetical protein
MSPSLFSKSRVMLRANKKARQNRGGRPFISV